MSKDTDDDEDDDDDDADESGSVEEIEPKSGDNTQTEADKLTSDLEKLTVDEKGTSDSDNVAGKSDTSEVGNQTEPTAAD